ncbi:MAG: glycoside hydrolase family 2, partial [Prevotellaceae bacterium]|nr:glycoside hydrolase family 2 [Prevotellaceae bacterium]
MKKLLLLVMFNVLCGGMYAQRGVETINEGWFFVKSEQESIPAENEVAWQRVLIPHSWNVEDAYVLKSYYRGIGWYRKDLFIPQSYSDKQLFLKFDGVTTTAEVFINGVKAGMHKGGYTAFVIDANSLLKVGENNTIVIKANNALQDVPPLSGDFTIFGGMYRDVWLISTNKIHFETANLASKGVFVETPDVSESSATVRIWGNVVNSSTRAKKVRLASTVYSTEGVGVTEMKASLTIKPNTKQPFTQLSKVIKNPLLWSPDSPNLYKVVTQIIDNETGVVIDEISNPLGFRWYSVNTDKGFFLNGKPLKLMGVCRHQDYKGLGNALTDEMHRRDMQLIKNLGANFVRISHYPQDDAVLEYCDRLGLLVWEEIPVVDLVSLNEEFSENCKINLREMIRQHYNHPSVVMWGYMNEVILKTVRSKEISEEEKKTIYNRTLELAKDLEQILHEEDKNRLSVMALHGDKKTYHEIGISAVANIVGWNLYQGWYGDKFSAFDRFIDAEKENYPNYPYIISEFGAGSDKRVHTFNPESFDFSMEHQQNYHEHYLPAIMERDYITGSTMWNFIDFGSANRDESMPRINSKGLVYSDRTPKDVYYYYK